MRVTKKADMREQMIEEAGIHDCCGFCEECPYSDCRLDQNQSIRMDRIDRLTGYARERHVVTITDEETFSVNRIVDLYICLED